MLAAQSSAPVIQSGEGVPADALAAIRAALMANMLPARTSVRIEDLVNRASASVEPFGSEGLTARPRAVLATAPWNDEHAAAMGRDSRTGGDRRRRGQRRIRPRP